jgi:hypothetical protein
MLVGNAALMAFPRLSRIFYSIFFTILNLVLLVLILITPSDAIHQALNNNQLYNVFVIAGCYVLTLLLAILIYASRLYTTRSVLAAIPKTWIPVEKGDVGKRVRKMIADSLARSALIAWDARPRLSNRKIADPPVREAQKTDGKDSTVKDTAEKSGKFLRKSRLTSDKDEARISARPHLPVWGEIAHEGWSSPCSLDLPNLQFIAVILELPHLIEAKAVSLAPPDPHSSASPPLPDLRAVELLQRPATMGLRDYTSHLASIGVLPPSKSVNSFLSSYEEARFSSQPLAEIKFRDLMGLFAEILRSMAALDPAIINTFHEEESDIDGDAMSTTTSESQRSRSLTSSHSMSTRSSSEGTIRTGPSRRRGKSRSIARQPKLSTAPATPRGKKRERIVEKSPSIQSFAQTKMPYPVSQASSISLRSGSSGSVIKLNHSKEPGDLPYSIHLTPSL